MRLSRYFLPVLKETPAEAQIVSHRLMLRAGLIRQEAAGIYAWLPLGFQVLKKIEQIVREEMERSGAVELLMPTLQLADLWRESGRYDDYGQEMLRITDRHEREMLYGPTNEEMITEIFRASVRSYKALPMNLFHIQWKFRDEQRPRFGVMRGREFLMKDAYSFDLDEASARRAYNRMFVAYLNTFAHLGLKSAPMRADTGPIGGDLSHEFIVLAETGESQVFCHRELVEMGAPGPDVNWDDLQGEVDRRTALYAATEEMHDAARFEREVPEADRLSARGIEVGHIFYFGEKYSRPMKAVVAGPDGVERPVHMGSYGVGVSRLMGAIIEASHDEAGIIWPDAVAPFDIQLINLKVGDAACDEACGSACRALEGAGRAVLFDDTDERPGAKFAKADLIGTPWQLVIGPKGIAAGEVELKRRATGEKSSLPLEAALKRLGVSDRGLALPARPFAGWETDLAMRYLRARRKEAGFALISIISFIGITLAVAILIIVMSIMNGFRTDLLGRIVGFNGHIYVQGPAIERQGRDQLLQRLRGVKGVVHVAPLTESQALVQSASQTQGGLVRGLSPQTLLDIPLVVRGARPRGSIAAFGRGESGGDEVLIGARLAESLNVQPGDVVTIVSPTGAATAMGALPTSKPYVVGGTFSVGMAEYDQAFIFMPIEQSQLLFGKEGRWDVVEIKVSDPDHLDAVKAAVARAAGPGAQVTDWRDRNASFFNALQVERFAMRIILSLLVLIAALNIISGMIMLVKNKGRDIAILRTMGASQGAILRIFLTAGTVIGAFGTALGMVLGLLFCGFIAQIQDFIEWVSGRKVFAPDVYFLSHIPARVEWVEVLFVVVLSLVAACAAALWPAWRASRIDPVEALRFE